MANKAYNIGRRYEYKAKKLLEQEGWQTVRAAGSKGAWDLVAFKEGEKVRCIQIKHTTSEVGMKRLLAQFKPQGEDSYLSELWVHSRGKWYKAGAMWCEGQNRSV